MLQTRTGKRSPAAAFRIAVDMADEGLINKLKKHLRGLRVRTSSGCFIRCSTPSWPGMILLAGNWQAGFNAVPGAAVGKAVFTAEDAEHWASKGEKVILVRRETSPEDVGGMYVAQGILTATGGKTSHAAVVARGWGKCCIVGAEQIDISYEAKKMSVDGHVVQRRRLDHARWRGRRRSTGRNRTGAAGTAESIRNTDEMGGQAPQTWRTHQCRYTA